MYGKISTYEEAVKFIEKIGFMTLSKNPFGFVSLEEITFAGNWHTGNEKDPWLWKDRLAFEKIASYSKVMGKRPAFISQEWYPYFLSMCRYPLSVEQRYENGIIGNMSLLIYRQLKDNRPLNTHELKTRLGINKENERRFENGLVELQGNMDITVFGACRRVDRQGENYGWLISEYTTVEQWAKPEVFKAAASIPRQEAVEKVVCRIKDISPNIAEKDIFKFLGIKKIN
ncbi:MAG: hypothetical protein Q8920_08630 [Bacillota bacterium]|nr:hypothetical protein [Bacillota bacterium]